MCVCLYCVSVYVFLVCEITPKTKTKMIVVTEAWVRYEIELTIILQISFLLSV